MYSHNLTNQRFGRLTALFQLDEKASNGERLWLCQCDCGGTKAVKGSHLISDNVRSCGCLRNKKIAGKRFGKLTAIEPDFNYPIEHNIKNSGNTIYWKCVCECGKICIKPYNDLAKGKALNCPECTQKSKGEEQIKTLLIQNKIPFIHDREYFKDLIGDNHLLRYDFILLQNNQPYRLIEFDGEQHFKPIEYFGGEERFLLQQKYDKIKSEYAHIHNLPLVRIPYTVKNITLDMLLEDGYVEEKFK